MQYTQIRTQLQSKSTEKKMTTGHGGELERLETTKQVITELLSNGGSENGESAGDERQHGERRAEQPQEEGDARFGAAGAAGRCSAAGSGEHVHEDDGAEEHEDAAGVEEQLAAADGDVSEGSVALLVG
uniref:Uncharacterized protein n=1 Tax=Oryza glumipatula TaxID=40148 RepID=A0A0E0ABI4_9ORYZ